MHGRQIVLDTETTGLDWKAGDRLCEIACVELSGQKSGPRYQQYLNPNRESSPEAFKVHGLSNQFLADYPSFSAIASEFLKFVSGAELIIHNAPFDVGFINNELIAIGKKPLTYYCPSIIDTRVLAASRLSRTLVMEKLIEKGYQEIVSSLKFWPNSLDNLCLYYGVSLETRAQHHGGLIDCELLVQVYHCLMQEKFGLTQQCDKHAISALPLTGFFQIQSSTVQSPNIVITPPLPAKGVSS